MKFSLPRLAMSHSASLLRTMSMIQPSIQSIIKPQMEIFTAIKQKSKINYKFELIPNQKMNSKLIQWSLHESQIVKKANYGRLRLFLGKVGRITNSKSELACELCYTDHSKRTKEYSILKLRRKKKEQITWKDKLGTEEKEAWLK